MSAMENHSEQFRLRLGQEVEGKYRFYLDTKYWIYLRNASEDGCASEIHKRIYDKLLSFVSTGMAICPLSPHSFFELLNIGDRQTRLSTARVMDELSQQICFISPIDIIGQELLVFVRNSVAKANGTIIQNPKKYVWTKVPFILGEFYPEVEGLPQSYMANLNILFFNKLAGFTLVELIEKLGTLPAKKSASFISRLNQGKDENQDWRSFHEVFMHEIAGMLDGIQHDIEQLWIYLYRADTGKELSSEEISQSGCTKMLSNLIYHAFAQKKNVDELPFIHIHAALHAYIRYKKAQRYKENDLIDFSHAAWALPYCNGFFTEKALSDWICNGLLQLDKVYNSTVLSDDEEILAYLENKIADNSMPS